MGRKVRFSAVHRTTSRSARDVSDSFVGVFSEVPHPASCINRPWRGAVAAVLPLGYRWRSLRLLAPHTDARERDSNKKEPATRNPRTLDPSLTLTRVQCPAIVGNTGNRKPLSYTGFANSCNAEQPLTAHS